MGGEKTRSQRGFGNGTSSTHAVNAAKVARLQPPGCALGSSSPFFRSFPDIYAFRKRLLAWYNANARDLPWRKDSDPYRVWVSEIMLQQTRVAAVLDHYHRFLDRFPTVQKLAAARESSVLTVWSGLGYYRRARMLHKAAKVVAKEFDGTFPATTEGLRELPGIGRYTAAAIASIAFAEPVAVVDGNVERVLQRILGQRLSSQETWDHAEAILDRDRPGDFNQSMMELGATVCTPRSPTCLTCPVIELCRTRGEIAAESKAPRQHKREIHYALDCREGKVFLVQRPSDTPLMPGMWELPEIPRPENGAAPAFTVRHSITTTDYRVNIWHVRCSGSGRAIRLQRVPKLAMTGLARKILLRAGILAAPTRSLESCG